MARSRKAINFDEEIMKVDAQIIRCENTILELKEKRKTLMHEKEQQEISIIYDTIRSSGLSMDEVLSLIKVQTNNIA